MTRTRLTVEDLEARDVPAAPFETLPILPTSNQAVLDNARAIADRGAELGRHTDVFMKVGDSNTAWAGLATTEYLVPLGLPGYNPNLTGLSNYGPSIVQTLDTFLAPVDALGENSFDRNSLSAYPGWTLPIVYPHVQQEVDAIDPGIAFIMIGTNDLAVYANPQMYQAQLGELVQSLESQGVLPVLSTLPDHDDNSANTVEQPLYNQVIADVGAEYDVPVWNLWSALEGLPYHGELPGNVHLNTSPYGGGFFDPTSLQYGQNIRNLEALQILDWYRTEVVGPAAAPSLPAWTPLTPGESVYAVGAGAGQAPVVSVYDSSSGKLVDQFLAYEASFTGGVNVAVGDVNSDGIPDIVTGPGSGGGPVVKVFSGQDGSLLGSAFAFEPSFRTGVNVAAADLTGSGQADVIVGAGQGGGPAVAVFSGSNLAPVERFFAFNSSFRGGVTVAAANLAGYGPSIVVGAGVGGGPIVEVFQYGQLSPSLSFAAYAPSARVGVDVAAGDLTGSGTAQIVTAPLAGSSDVRVIDPSQLTPLEEFFAGPATAVDGVRVAVDGGDLLVANGPGSSLSVNAYSGLSTTPSELPPTDPNRAYGISIA